MKISHPLSLAGFGTVLAIALAPGSYASTDAPTPVTASAESAASGTVPESAAEAPLIATTILPSKNRPHVSLAVINAARSGRSNPLGIEKPIEKLTETPLKPLAQKPEPIRTTAPTTLPGSAPVPATPVPTAPPVTPLPPSTAPAESVPTQSTPAESTPSVVPSSPSSTPAPVLTTPPADASVSRDPRALLPEYLNPDPNPLQFPTKPEEVTLKGVQPISLQEAIALAERNNRTLEQTRLQLEQSKFSLREAEAAKFPSIFVQGDLSRGKTSQAELGRRIQLNQLEQFQSRASALNQLKDADDAQTQLNLGVQLSYDLFTSGSRKATIKAAERQVRLGELEVERVLEQTRFDVSSDYYDLQNADEQIITNTAAVTSAQSNLRDAQAQFDAGLGTRFDVLRAQVQLANNQQQLTSAIATRDVERRQLAQRLSLRESVGVRASDPVAVAGVWNWSMEETIVRAYKSRAELEQQLVQREISAQRRKVALAALGPTVTLNVQGNLLDQFEDSLGIAFGSGYTVSAQARWQLFDGGAARARAGQQEKNIQIAESRFAEARNTIRFEVESAYTTLLSNQASIQTTEAAVRQAEEALRLAILRFQAGVGTQTDRITAEADLTRARGNRTSAIIGYNRSLAQLRRSVSNLSTNSLSSLTSGASPSSPVQPVISPAK